jgi:hypothetical protein
MIVPKRSQTCIYGGECRHFPDHGHCEIECVRITTQTQTISRVASFVTASPRDYRASAPMSSVETVDKYKRQMGVYVFIRHRQGSDVRVSCFVLSQIVLTFQGTLHGPDISSRRDEKSQEWHDVVNSSGIHHCTERDGVASIGRSAPNARVLLGVGLQGK